MQAKRDLFTIGEFSKITGMSIHSLRYYDEIGALKPEYVDPVSNYRYYSFEQLRCVPGINMCIDAGIKLSEFSSFVSDGLIDYTGIIHNSRAALDKRIEEFSKQKERLEMTEKMLSQIRSISENETVPIYFEGRSVWAIPVEEDTIQVDEADILIRLSQHARRHGCQISPSFFGLMRTLSEEGWKHYAFADIDSVSDQDKCSPFIIYLEPGDYLLKKCSSCSLRNAEEIFSTESERCSYFFLSFTILGESLTGNQHFAAVRCL